MTCPQPAVLPGAASILNRFLGEYAKRAFTLEADDHILTLYHEGQVVARGGNSWTIEEIQTACHQHWNEHLSGISYGGQGC